MKIQIKSDKFEELLEKHWEWFKAHINDRENKPNKKNQKIIPKIKDILNTLSLGNTVEDLKPIIIAKKKDCLDYIKIYKGKISNSKEILDFFSYDDWSKKYGDWNAYKFIQELGIRVCPYCNRNNIDYSEVENGKLITRSPFDHFFPKSEYPYLSCSLFNLIPCCNTCNSAKRAKDTVEENIIYPYEEEFGEDGKFRLKYNGEELDEKTMDIIRRIFKNCVVQLQSSGGLENSINESKDTFRLEDIYSQEQNFIQDLLDKIYMYSENLDRAKLIGLTEKMFFALFFNLPRDENKIYSYQKITMDIIEQCAPDLKNIS